MPNRFFFAWSCLGFGAFLGILAVQLDPALAVRNPPAWCLAFMGLFAVTALVSLPRRT